jgi:hypothetical protein
MRALLEFVMAMVFVTFAALAIRWRPSFSGKVIGHFKYWSKHKFMVLSILALLPLGFRLALLPILAIPGPYVSDEFSHLLEADTLVHGRWANPTHALWRHLETVYVLQRPTYSSIYPLGQGAVIAAGQFLFASPWSGVLLSVVLMCGAVTWMLYGCLPPEWAAVGEFVSVFQYGLADRWVNSYMGGAFCAFGGALLFGSLCRLRRSPSLSMALLAGLGWSVVWLTRPFESIMALMMSWGLIGAFIARDRRLWKTWLAPSLLIVFVQLSALGVTAVQNRAVTGSLMKLPYQISQESYGVPQGLLWQKPVQEPSLPFAELRDMYAWQRATRDWASAHIFRQFGRDLFWAWYFFVGYWYSVPLVLLILTLRDSHVRVGIGLTIGALTVSAMYPFFYPQYIAAYTCIICFLIARGLMIIGRWGYGRRPVGLLLVLFLVSGSSLTAFRMIPFHRQPGPLRASVLERLLQIGGRHVVFVRYGTNHEFHDEWVYNSANIDASSVVWCRAIDPSSDDDVAQYYKGRTLWVADVDQDVVRISPFQPEQSDRSMPDSVSKPRAWAVRRRPE